ncbi:MAG: diadenylate cyclase CdaA [Planctomycetes bacterium]|nr:diadenylate cyclase CdaA [Planctomycetota bacterium]NUQ35657.1 TIGR00159 family protein [Planctomycetaceae bacterium]
MDYLIYAVEIAMIYAGLAVIYSFVRGSTGDSAVRGVTIIIAALLVGSYFIAKFLHFYRIELLLSKSIDYLIFGLLIIFQPELRRGVVRLGQNRIFRTLVRGRDDVVSMIAIATFRMARSRTGALMVIERGVGLSNYAERGTTIDAKFSSELLDTIFFDGSPLHDGGIIIRGSRIVAAGCLFPLTESPTLSKRLGTRHRAGIGITEESDAVSIIVSEETGRVSIAVRGELEQDLDREAFEKHLRNAMSDVALSDRELAGEAQA